MKIGIDISQLAYAETGVSNYLFSLISSLIKTDSKNEYILFYSSLRRELKSFILNLKVQNVQIKQYRLSPSILDLLWNKLHIFPIEWFIGNVDVFITSDWIEPPTQKAKKVTILYDLIVYKYPNETDSKIIDVQKRKLKWVKKESDIIFCISQATKKDAKELIGIDEHKLHILYPGA